MRSTHRVAIAVALALSAAAGAAAATQTVHLGADAKKATPPSAAALAAQQAKLNAADHSIRRALSATPPPLPPVPTFPHLGEPKVAPLVITRVVPAGGPSSATAEVADRTPSRHASSPAPRSTAPAPAATAPAPARQVVRGGHEGEDHNGGAEEASAKDHSGDQGSGGSAGRSGHDD